MIRNIHDFIFLGGSTKIEKRSKEPSEAFSSCARELVGYYPAIFPEGCDPLKGADSAIVDIPMNRDSMRCFCVYFCVSTGRSFWNVLCFSYSVKDWSRNDLQCALALSAREWYDLALTLHEDQSFLSLPDGPADMVPDVESWLPDGVFARDFPISPTRGLTESMPYENDWRALLQLPRKIIRPPKPIPLPDPPPPPRRCSNFLLGLLSGIILGGLASHVITRHYTKERADHSDTSQPITRPPSQEPSEPQSRGQHWIIEISPRGVVFRPVKPRSK